MLIIKTNKKIKKRKLLKTFLLSKEKGIPLKFIINLPPNIKSTAPLDMIVIKVEVEINGNKAIPIENVDKSLLYFLPKNHIKIAQYLESWSKENLITSILQLSRYRLKKLLEIFANEPVVFLPDKQKKPLILCNKKILEEIYDCLKIKDNENNINTINNTSYDSINDLLIDGSTRFLSIDIPLSNNPLYIKIKKLIEDYGFKFEPSNNKWWLRDKHKVLNFLSNNWLYLKKENKIKFTSNFKKRTSKIIFSQIYSEASNIGNDFEITTKMNIFGADEKNFRNNINKEQFYLQSPKGIVLIPKSKIDQLTYIQRALSGEPDRTFSQIYYKKINLYEIIDTDFIVRKFSDIFKFPKIWKNIINSIKNMSEADNIPCPNKLKNLLRPYQKIGTFWLWNLYKYKLGGVLADEMGLGKTVQAIAFLNTVYNEEKNVKLLVVCPAGLIENWRREINTFAKELKVFCHHGFNRLQSINQFEDYVITLTSYNTLTRDFDLFSKIKFNVIIADEAQNIKNKNTQNAKTLRNLNSISRVLLTGTPIENSLNDLRSLFSFLMPNYLANPPLKSDRELKFWYNERNKLQASHYILRRSKKIVAPELPDKIEQIIYCKMDGIQLKMYENLLDETRKNIFSLESSDKTSNNSNKLKIFNQLLKLRQICVDPRIIDNTLSSKESSKLRAFKDILQETINGGHRILVFSQFVSLLKLIKIELEKDNINYLYIDGKTNNRVNICNTFNENNHIPILLISLKAGGYGLNITGADTVIHFDPWWNPAVESQATDRAHRIGQKRVVTSMKLIVSDSIEEKIVSLQKSRVSLLEDLFHTSENINTSLNIKNIKEILKI